MDGYCFSEAHLWVFAFGKKACFSWADADYSWMCMQQRNLFFLYLQQLTFYSLLEKNKNLSFTSLSITNKMEQSSLAEMHLPREYGRVSQHLFPAVFLSLAFNFNNYLPVPLLSFPLLRYFVLLLWLSVLFCLKCFRICYHGYRCQNWK